MVWKVNNLELRGILEGILEDIGDFCNNDGEVVGDSNGKNLSGV